VSGSAQRPAVGFFDSGVGGISVARAFLRLRPSARVLYTADWSFCPYGARPDAEILARSREVLAGLVALGARLAVVACNSASAVALDTLRAENPGLPIVGMEPAVKPAAALSRTGAVGILATAHTLRGRLFRETSARFAAGVRVVPAVGEGFVELVESGDLSSPAARETVRRVLAPLLAARCDPIVLGCTHYPFLLPLLREAAPGTAFLDPSEAVARRAAALYDRLAGVPEPEPSAARDGAGSPAGAPPEAE
jgi:glutamate racemase